MALHKFGEMTRELEESKRFTKALRDIILDVVDGDEAKQIIAKEYDRAIRNSK